MLRYGNVANRLQRIVEIRVRRAYLLRTLLELGLYALLTLLLAHDCELLANPLRHVLLNLRSGVLRLLRGGWLLWAIRGELFNEQLTFTLEPFDFALPTTRAAVLLLGLRLLGLLWRFGGGFSRLLGGLDLFGLFFVRRGSFGLGRLLLLLLGLLLLLRLLVFVLCLRELVSCRHVMPPGVSCCGCCCASIGS